MATIASLWFGGFTGTKINSVDAYQRGSSIAIELEGDATIWLQFSSRQDALIFADELFNALEEAV